MVKGSNYLEALAGTRTVVFDKTGTITQGVFEVCGIHGTNCASGSCPVESGHPVYEEEEQLLEYAALAECHSTHPISVSLQKAYGKKLDVHRVTDVQEIGGHGVIATVDGHRVAAGNDKLMKKKNCVSQLQLYRYNRTSGSRWCLCRPYTDFRYAQAECGGCHAGTEKFRRAPAGNADR